MSELEKIRLNELSVDERADIAQDLFIANAKGEARRSLAKRYNLTEYAVRILIEEYGAYMTQTRTHSKEANIAVYDYLIKKGIEVMENPTNHPALVQAKAPESILQALTRKDKLLGHEAPTHHVSTTGETLKDIITGIYGYGGQQEGGSPIDGGYIGEEEILEGEVVDYEAEEG